MDSYIASLAASIPVTPLKETVRYIRLSDCSELTQLFFEFAFPRFFSADDFRTARERGFAMPATYASTVKPFAQLREERDKGGSVPPGSWNAHLISEADNALKQLISVDPDARLLLGPRRRRYSGDLYPYLTDDPDGLARGRYYAVTRRSGHDLGLLRHELLSYSNFDETGEFLLLDGLLPSEDLTAELVKAEKDMLYCAILPGATAHSRFLAFLENRLDDVTPEARAQIEALAEIKFLSLIGIRTTREEIKLDKCLDLRLHAAREWLLEVFRDGCPTITGLAEPISVNRFDAMIPALLALSPGGGVLTQAIGMLLRRLGVEGLVYPSARHYWIVSCGIDGHIVDSSGWNLVDYRQSAAPKLLEEAGMVVVSRTSTAADVTKRVDDLQAAGKEPRVVVTLDSLWQPADGAYDGRGAFGDDKYKDCILLVKQRELLSAEENQNSELFLTHKAICRRGHITVDDVTIR